MAPKPLPRLGPNPTPITEYLAHHPEATLMSLAKVSGLHYDTVHKAERGQTPPQFVTLLKLQETVGIPVMAWAGIKAVQVQMERRVTEATYREKAERWRKKKRANDPAFREKEDAKFRRRGERRKAARHGEAVALPPMSPLKAALLGIKREG